ncbi:MAG: asparagine synthase (glutamine-hydrolyzing) [Kiritimatiellae bacterium]|nr:asparagine synthase (glutamine-hydrolyzing) [Kiritimatiellia bacterium]
MCGIVGICSNKPVADRALLARMRDTMLHRGPDDAGEWWSLDGRVGLAHRRLSIIDLSPAGHQPMTDPSGQYVIVLNGEIYNFQELRHELEIKGHSFRSKSDTEVLLTAYREWGTECLSHLNGAFAFGIYDSSRRCLFLARDRVGEKPLFYCMANGELTFASELKALMANPDFPRRLNLKALEYYLAFGYVPGSHCILENVKKLPPAHALTFNIDSGETCLWRYWQLPEPPQDQECSEEALEKQLEQLLEDAVRKQLVADVPVGVLLSGGVDSSLITAMAARVSSRPVKTFTIAFPGHGAYDDAPYARLVARHFGTEHVELAPDQTSSELLPLLAKQYDEPIADSSMVPTFLVTQLVCQQVKVALSGDGGDELFGGYLHYSWIQSQERIRRLIPRPIRGMAKYTAANALPVGLYGRNYIIYLMSDLQDGLVHSSVYFDASSRGRLLTPLGPKRASISAEALRRSLILTQYSPLQQSTRLDFNTTLPDTYCVKMDRASMLNSLEVRAPLLDCRIIEFAFGQVPDYLRATTRERKILSRRLAERLLPRQLDLKRKQGFSLPLQAWFKGEWGRYMENVLTEADPNMFDPHAIKDLLAGQRRGRSNTSRLFALTIFELWRREYRVNV